MKKILLLIIALVCAQEAFGQQVEVGTYTHGGKEHSVTVEESRGVLLFTIRIDDSEKVGIMLRNDDEIRSFQRSLIQLRDKYTEWIDIAKKNNITDFKKAIPIKFEPFTVGWYSSSWHFDFHVTPNLLFIVKQFDVVRYACTLSGEATASNNEYITQKWNWSFFSPDEIDALLPLCDVSYIHKCLDKNNDVSDLFQ